MNYPAPLLLRLATERDAETLLAWRNDPITRANSHNTDLVALDTHLAWMQSLPHRGILLLIAERAGYPPVPCGTLRVDPGDHPVLSWTVAPSARGYGIGTAMLRMFVAGTPNVPYRAEIKHDNAPSIRMAQACGFSIAENQDGYAIWERQIR